MAHVGFAPGDAALDVVADVFAGGRTAYSASSTTCRWRRRHAFQVCSRSPRTSGRYDAQPGHTVDELLKVIDEEIAKLQRELLSDREVQRDQQGRSVGHRMERVGGFGGKADLRNAYFSETGLPDWFNEDLGRYRVLSPADIRAAAVAFLPADRRVELTVMPDKP